MLIDAFSPPVSFTYYLSTCSCFSSNSSLSFSFLFFFFFLFIFFPYFLLTLILLIVLFCLIELAFHVTWQGRYCLFVIILLCLLAVWHAVMTIFTDKQRNFLDLPGVILFTGVFILFNIVTWTRILRKVGSLLVSNNFKLIGLWSLAAASGHPFSLPKPSTVQMRLTIPLSFWPTMQPASTTGLSASEVRTPVLYDGYKP